MERKDYVSNDVAQLLKDKGYDVPCRSMYDSNTDEFKDDCCNEDWNHKNWCGKTIESFMSVPSLYEAQQWLREKHNILVIAACTFYDYYGKVIGLKYYFNMDNISSERAYQEDLDKCLQDGNKEPQFFNSYQEALNEGIKEALKLI